jgi:hypothetical protein
MLVNTRHVDGWPNAMPTGSQFCVVQDPAGAFVALLYQ